MGTEKERIKKIIEDMAKGNNTGDRLGYLPHKKRIIPISPERKPDSYIEIEPPDADLFSHIENGQIIVMAGEVFETINADEDTRCFFAKYDDGEVFSLIPSTFSSEKVPGTIHYSQSSNDILLNKIGQRDDRVRVIISRNKAAGNPSSFPESFDITGFVRNQTGWQRAPVQITPIKDEIFSRSKGLIETDVLSEKFVAVFGVGSGGSFVALELAKSGVNLIIIDHQRLEVANISRHVAGLSQVGRRKTKIMADLIHDRNPFASVDTFDIKVTWDNMEQVREIVRRADLVLAATDNKRSKRILNRLCVEENKPCIFAGASRRAYMGQILFMRKPYKSPCYQCFLSLLPEQIDDVEVADQELARELSYTDRPVAIEPGLSSHITPISLMTVILVIQYLLQDKHTTLRSLDDDLVASWFIWLNRREIGTPFEALEPLEFHVDGMHILRWYGIDLKPYEACPVCGNFEYYTAKQAGIQWPEHKLDDPMKSASTEIT